MYFVFDIQRLLQIDNGEKLLRKLKISNRVKCIQRPVAQQLRLPVR